jgi:hypothetical protein
MPRADPEPVNTNWQFPQSPIHPWHSYYSSTGLVTIRMKWMGETSLLLGILAVLSLCAGCQAPSLPAQPSGNFTEARAGQVYLIRGLLGIFSTGMDNVEHQLREHGVRAITLQHTETGSLARTIIAQYRQDGTSAEPIILIGHSLGADEVISVAQMLNEAHVPVTMAITVDPVTADPVPPNVAYTANYYRSNPLDFLPFFRGIRLKQQEPGRNRLDNIDLNNRQDLLEPGTNHFTIDKNKRVERAIVQQVLAVCPPHVILAAQRIKPATVPTSRPVVGHLLSAQEKN